MDIITVPFLPVFRIRIQIIGSLPEKKRIQILKNIYGLLTNKVIFLVVLNAKNSKM
jgi:hypothetical protein